MMQTDRFSLALLQILLLFVLLIFIFLSGCASRGTTSYTSKEEDKEEGFALHIIDCRWGVAGSPYNPFEAFLLVDDCYPDKTIFTITGEHIDRYNWTNHQMKLTLAATQLLDAELGKGWLGRNYAFLLSVDNQMIYCGFFYDPRGAAAIAFPVIYLEMEKENVILNMKPSHFRHQSLEWDDLSDQRLHKFLRESGKYQ